MPRSLNIFTWKNKRCYVYLLVPYSCPLLSRGHQTVTIMNHCCYCFDGFWKVQVKDIVLFLNVFLKLKNSMGASRLPVVLGNWPTCNHLSWPYQFCDLSLPGSVQGMRVCGNERNDP